MLPGTGSAVVLGNARVVTPAGVLDPGWVRVGEGRILAVGEGAAPTGTTQAHEGLDGSWLVPGFLDLHMHGGGGHDVGASAPDTLAAIEFHRRHGTTRAMVSLVTAPVDLLARQLGWIAALAREWPHRILGAHLEGPFLSHARCGAQNPAHLLDPDPAILDRLVEAADGALRSVTVAPELPGALDLVARVREAGAVAAVGHSDATYDQTRAAVDAGVGLGTHLFNGMRPLHHREPGAVGGLLAADVPCELINDGVHVHPSVLAWTSRLLSRPVLVTDAISATGTGDGDAELGGQPISIRDGTARLISDGSLAGSTLTMDEAVRRAVRDSGLTVPEAVAAATTNPAHVLGLDHECGAVTPGLAADLVVLDEALEVRAVMCAGSWQDR